MINTIRTITTSIAMALAALAMIMFGLAIVLAVTSAYAYADSISTITATTATTVPIPPITSVSISGTTTTGTFTSQNNYYLTGATNGCESNCLQFEVEDGVYTGRSTVNFASVYGFADAGGSGEMFGHLGRVTFNAQTDVLSGVFGGKEGMVAMVNGKWWPEYWYTVKGTFSENIGTGAGSVSLSSETFIGTTAVPEPEEWVMLVTGLCGIAGVVRRKMQMRMRP